MFLDGLWLGVFFEKSLTFSGLEKWIIFIQSRVFPENCIKFFSHI